MMDQLIFDLRYTKGADEIEYKITYIANIATSIYIFQGNTVMKITRGLLHKYVLKVYISNGDSWLFIRRKTFDIESRVFEYLKTLNAYGVEIPAF